MSGFQSNVFLMGSKIIRYRIFNIYGRENKENIVKEKLWLDLVWGIFLFSLEKTETHQTYWWGQMDHQGCCQGNRHQALYSQAHPILVQEGGQDLWKEEKKHRMHGM